MEALREAFYYTVALALVLHFKRLVSREEPGFTFIYNFIFDLGNSLHTQHGVFSLC